MNRKHFVKTLTIILFSIIFNGCMNSQWSPEFMDMPLGPDTLLEIVNENR